MFFLSFLSPFFYRASLLFIVNRSPSLNFSLNIVTIKLATLDTDRKEEEDKGGGGGKGETREKKPAARWKYDCRTTSGTRIGLYRSVRLDTRKKMSQRCSRLFFHGRRRFAYTFRNKLLCRLILCLVASTVHGIKFWGGGEISDVISLFSLVWKGGTMANEWYWV